MKPYRQKFIAVSGVLMLVLFAHAEGDTVQGLTAQSATHDGMPVGFTAEGHPYIGKVDAPVTLEEWSDYLCPFCGRHFRQTLPLLLDQYVRTGQLKLVFRDLPLASLHPTAAMGHVAANCVGEQGAAAYWSMHDALFARQGEWNRLPDPSAFLAKVAGELGVDTKAYAACVGSDASASRVQASVDEGRGLGYNGTPSFRFSSTASDTTYSFSGAHPMGRFSRYVDALADGEEPPEDPKPEPPELPFWAKPEGLAPDPQRAGFTMAGDAYKGNPEAKVVVVEFNDYQCEACNRHALQEQPAIDEALVDTGKVLWVEKHLPLREHEHALVAAVAAECAGEQSLYWAMNSRLHAESDRWVSDDPDSVLIELAGDLGLDNSEFRECLRGRSGLERVVDDIYDAQGVVTSTPRFVILHDGHGAVTGPLPAAQFIDLLSNRVEDIEVEETQ